MDASFGANNYFPGAAGGVRAGDLLSPADSFTYGDATWKSEAGTPYILSPRPDHDDGDILADFPQTHFFGLDQDVPLENQTMFPPHGEHGQQPNPSFGLGVSTEPFPGFSHIPIDNSGPNWQFGGSSFSDRLYNPGNDEPAPEPSKAPEDTAVPTPKLLDLRFAEIKPAAGQDLDQEVYDLIVKVQNGYNIQELSTHGVMDAVEALRQGLTATLPSGTLRGLSSQDIHTLLVRGASSDPIISNGCFVEPLTAEHLQKALDRYGAPRKQHYKLGIVRNGQETFQFEVSLLPNPPPQEGQIIIWVYQDLFNYNMSTGQYHSCRWSAIAPSNVTNIMTKNYAQALSSPTPKPVEPQTPVNTSLLHVGRRGTGSSQSGTPSTSSSSSAPTKCCGKVWTSKLSFKNHEKSHSRPDDRPFKCNQCERGFLWQKDLNRHMPRHNGNRDYVCPVRGCEKSYTRRDNMVRHHDDAHPEQRPLSTKSRGSSDNSRYHSH